MEDLLDDNEVNNLGVTKLKSELQKLSFWLRFSGILLLIVGILFSFLLLKEISFSLTYYHIEELVMVLILGVVTLSMSFLGIKHFRFIKKNDSYCLSESNLALQEIAKEKQTNWRLVAFIFSMIGLPITFIVIFILYSTMSYYSDGIEQPMPQIESMDLPKEESIPPSPSN